MKYMTSADMFVLSVEDILLTIALSIVIFKVGCLLNVRSLLTSNTDVQCWWLWIFVPVFVGPLIVVPFRMFQGIHPFALSSVWFAPD